MYKPVPFFMSSRGYGMFIHTTTPITLDFGHDFSGVNSMMIGDDELDFFVFLGTPKEILDEYTKLTGKSPLPPLWSFGLWMSRCTYNAEKQVRDIAAKLRENKIPCDVLHLDTGWFETDWQCDYEFSTTRFTDPKKMLADLKSDGFRVSCWQLPYFVPKNKLFPELVAQNLVVRDAKGNLPYEDAVLDFSNPKTVEWYQGKLANLLNEGVSAIKVDFGEAAPEDGIYADGRTGFYEHNLYPLRYNKAVADITETDHRRQHHLGAQRVGRQPALSDSLGRRRRKHRRRHGGGIARRAVVRPVRLFVLEPRRRRLHGQFGRRHGQGFVRALAGVRHVEFAQPLSRRGAEGTVELWHEFHGQVPHD